MSQKLIITNCEDPSIVLSVTAEDLEFDFPIYGSIGLSHVEYEMTTNDLCISHLTYTYSDDGTQVEDVIATVVDTYNEFPVYAIPINWFPHPHNVYLLFNSVLNRWEIWRNFIDGEPSCQSEPEDIASLASVCDVCNGDYADIPMMYSTTPDLETTTWVPSYDGNNPTNGCDYSGVQSIGSISFCGETQNVDQDVSDCWLVDLEREPTYPLPVIFDFEITDITEYDDCEACLNNIRLRITNCENDDIQFIIDIGDQEHTNESIVSISAEGYTNCWLLEEIDAEETGDLVTITTEITETHVDCETCIDEQPVDPPDPPSYPCEYPTLYLLEPCDGGNPVYSSDINLEATTGDYIRVPYLNDRCFFVHDAEEVTEEVDFYTTIEFEGTFTSCFECYPKPIVIPDFTHDCCDADKIEKVTCEYAEVVEKKILEKRFAITTLKQGEELNKKIRYEALQNQLQCLDYPPFPEPVVHEGCLEITEVCKNPLQNTCRTCDTPSPTVSQQNPCCNKCDCGPCREEEPEEIIPEEPICEINPCGLTCYTNTFRILDNHILAATGNDNPNKNGRVFLGYYSCGFPDVKTEIFTQTGSAEVCAIGQILLGYYRNNIFTPIPFVRTEDTCENECGDNLNFE